MTSTGSWGYSSSDAAGTGDGIQLVTTLRGHDDVILRACWSPDGSTIATTSVDKTIRLRDPRTGELRRSLLRHRHRVNEVAWALDGSWIASASFDRTGSNLERQISSSETEPVSP
jgi:WD40 repeat protein